MGLCKCERKKVTTLFCYEHRVNVCEFCLVASHSKCVVKAYLRWLTDSNFDPTCGICNKRLDIDGLPCVRLVCLDVFHWDCLNKLASSLPPTTTPAGYLCPTCSNPIIPRPNQGGPVAESLRQLLDTTEWSKAALSDNICLTSPIKPASSKSSSRTSETVTSPQRAVKFDSAGPLLDRRLDAAAGRFLSGQDVPTVFKTDDHRVQPEQSSVCVTTASILTSSSASSSAPSLIGQQRQRRDQFESDKTYPSGRVCDDEDKYKRRSAFDWLARLLKTQTVSRNLPVSMLRKRRTVFACVLFCIGILTLILNLHQLRQSDITGDPLLDPKMNPNLRIAPLVGDASSDSRGVVEVPVGAQPNAP